MRLPSLDDYDTSPTDDDPVEREIVLAEAESYENYIHESRDRLVLTGVIPTEGANIDWDDIQYNDNGTYKFPMKLKFQPKHMGYGLCEKVPDEYKDNHKFTKTKERCYICDRAITGNDGLPPDSMYTQGTTTTGLTSGVFIQQDGKPVCSVCMGYAKASAAELARDSEALGGHITPEGARKALEAQQREWAHQDRERDKGHLRASYKDLEHD